MAKKVTYGSVKRLGTRYGRTLRFKLGKIESEQRKRHKCPYCSYVQVRRLSAGIWECKKCGAKFTNKAYTVGKVTTSSNRADSDTQKMDSNPIIKKDQKASESE